MLRRWRPSLSAHVDQGLPPCEAVLNTANLEQAERLEARRAPARHHQVIVDRHRAGGDPDLRSGDRGALLRVATAFFVFDYGLGLEASAIAWAGAFMSSRDLG